MFDATTIKAELLGLVGWRQNTDVEGMQLTGMTTSESGLYFNDVHPMLTFDNLLSVAPEYDLQFFTNATRDAAFTAWLQQKTEQAIIEAVDDWYTRKSSLRTATNLLDNNKLFKSTGNFSDLEQSTGKNVGIEFIVSRSQSLRMKLMQVGLQFDTNQTITLSLFKSGQKAPEQTLAVNYTGNGSVQWVTVDWQMLGEGSYLLAYDQRQIAGNAINGIRDFTSTNAGLTEFPTGRYYRATSFAAIADDLSELWDVSANTYTTATNYGLNVAFDLSCNYTDFIVEQKQLFKTAVSLRVAMKMLREMAFNPSARVNRNEGNITRAQVLFEIDGDTQGNDQFSIASQYERAISAIQFDGSNIDKICLPCRRRGIRWKAKGPG